MIIDELSNSGGDSSAEAYSGATFARANAEVTDPLAGAEQLPEAFFNQQESEDLLLAATKMAEYVENTPKVVYFKLAGGPLIVSATITAEQAVKNFEVALQQKKREALGAIWTDAVKKYEALEQRIKALNGVEQLEVLKKRLLSLKGTKVSSANDTFFTQPTLEKAIGLADQLSGMNDADKLIKFVEQITGQLPDKAVSTGETLLSEAVENLDFKTPITPKYNYLTGKPLAVGKSVDSSFGTIAHYSSLSGEPFRSLSNHITRKAYRGLVSGKGDDQVVMYVTPEEAEKIQSVDSRWAVYTGDVP